MILKSENAKQELNDAVGKQIDYTTRREKLKEERKDKKINKKEN